MSRTKTPRRYAGWTRDKARTGASTGTGTSKKLGPRAWALSRYVPGVGWIAEAKLELISKLRPGATWSVQEDCGRTFLSIRWDRGGLRLLGAQRRSETDYGPAPEGAF